MKESEEGRRFKEIKNLGASVRAGLLNIAKQTNRDFNAVLLQYFQERFLYRLSVSPYKSAFILKGAMMQLAYHWSRRTIEQCSAKGNIKHPVFRTCTKTLESSSSRPRRGHQGYPSNSLIRPGIDM